MVAGYGTGINNAGEKKSSPFIGAAFQLGCEYTFWFPLQLSVDFRPSFLVPAWMNRANVNRNVNRWCGFALAARYAF